MEMTMQTERILVANVKCGGCADTIKAGLGTVSGVESVDVDVAEGAVTVALASATLAAVKDKLADLGYPAR
jgi:copper chaperone CopZ